MTRRSGSSTPRAACRRCTTGGPMLGQMLRELVASGGMKPQGGGSTKPPPDLQVPREVGSADARQSRRLGVVHVIAEQYRQFSGIFGGCWFAQMHQKPDGLNSIVDSFNAITGWNFTLDEAMDGRPPQHDSAKPLRHPARLDRRSRLAGCRANDSSTRSRRQVPRLHHRQVAARSMSTNTIAYREDTNERVGHSRRRWRNSGWKNSCPGAKKPVNCDRNN